MVGIARNAMRRETIHSDMRMAKILVHGIAVEALHGIAVLTT
jgi:hypothetical protein